MDEGGATSTIAWAMKKHKESKDFKNNAAEAGVDTYIFGFNDCNNKVAQAYSKLDLSSIFVDRAILEKEEGEEEAIAEEENGRVEKPVARGPKPEVATTESLKELAIVLEKDT